MEPAAAATNDPLISHRYPPSETHTMSRALIAGAALSLAALLAAATPSAATNKPIPGIDIIVEKIPPPPSALVVASVNSENTFAGQLRLTPGSYRVSTACSPGVRCPAHRLTSLMVNGRTVSTAARGGVRVAVGDLNGDGREELTTFRGTITLIR
jgi:hypothetical protein